MSQSKVQKVINILTAGGLAFLVSSFIYKLFKVIHYKSIPIQGFLVNELGNILTILFVAVIVATSYGKSAKAQDEAIERIKVEQAAGRYRDFPSAWYWLYLLSAAGISFFAAYELTAISAFRSYPPMKIFFILMALFIVLGFVWLAYARKHYLEQYGNVE